MDTAVGTELLALWKSATLDVVKKSAPCNFGYFKGIHAVSAQIETCREICIFELFLGLKFVCAILYAFSISGNVLILPRLPRDPITGSPQVVPA